MSYGEQMNSDSDDALAGAGIRELIEQGNYDEAAAQLRETLRRSR